MESKNMNPYHEHIFLLFKNGLLVELGPALSNLRYFGALTSHIYGRVLSKLLVRFWLNVDAETFKSYKKPEEQGYIGTPEIAEDLKRIITIRGMREKDSRHRLIEELMNAAEGKSLYSNNKDEGTQEEQFQEALENIEALKKAVLSLRRVS